MGCIQRRLKMFRRVDLPAQVPGRLLLHSMPGRFEAIDKVWQQVKSDAVGAIVCLTEEFEIRLKSSKYADALETGTVPCSVVPFEIREGGVPADREAFWALANDLADRLRSGEALLIHCAGGVGRTAMLAVSVLLALGNRSTKRKARCRGQGRSSKPCHRSTCFPGALRRWRLSN